MLEGLLTLFQPQGARILLRDVLDILVVAYAVYRLLLLLRGTRAMQVGLGLALVVLVYVIAQRAGLVTAYTLLDRFLASFLLLVVVIFQADIRRALMRVGNRPFLLRWRKAEETGTVEEVISAATLLAQRRVGALIVFEREALLDDFAQQGQVLDAEVSRELLYTLFLPGYENPLHDGAVIIKNSRIWKAGAILPLTTNPTLDRTLGTRHRAALGISEETDAVVVIVSEERGQVSLCFNGNIVRGLDAHSLRQALYGLFYSKRRAAALLKSAAAREHEAPIKTPVRASVATETRPPEPGRPSSLRPERRPDETGRASRLPGERRPDESGRASRVASERKPAPSTPTVPPTPASNARPSTPPSAPSPREEESGGEGGKQPSPPKEI